MTIKARNIGSTRGQGKLTNVSVRLRQYMTEPGRYEFPDGYVIWRTTGQHSGTASRWLIDLRGNRVSQAGDLETAEYLMGKHKESQPETADVKGDQL